MADLLDTLTAVLKLKIVEEGTDSLKNVGDHLGVIGAAAKVATVGLAGIAGGLAASVKSASDFEDTLKTIQANTGQSAAGMAQMRSEILKLGSEGPAKLDDISKGFERASNLGYTGADAMKVVQTSWKAAIATGGQVGDMTNTLGSVMRNFHISASNAAGAMDTLMTAAASGNVRLPDLASNFSKIGIIASSIKMPLKDAATTYSELTRATGDAAQAQTLMVGMLTHMISPTKAATTEMQALHKSTGIDLVSDFKAFAAGNMSFTKVMEDARAATRDNASEIMTLFGGIRGGVGALKILGSGWQDYLSISDKVHNHTIDVNQAFKNMQDTLSFKWDTFVNQITEVGIAVGTKLLPPVTEFVGFLSSHVNDVTGFFTNVVGSVQRFGSELLKDFGSGGNVALFKDALTNIKNGLGDLGGAFTDILKSFGLFTSGAGDSKSKSDDLKTAVHDLAVVTDDVASGFNKAAGFVKDFSGLIVPLGAGILTYKGYVVAAQIATEAWTVAQGALDVALDANPIGLVVAGVAALALGVYEAYNKIKPFHDAVDALGYALQNLASVGIKAVTDLWSWTTTKFNEIRDGGIGAIGNMVGGIMGKLGDLLAQAIPQLGELAIKGVEAFGQLELQGLAKLKEFAGQIGGWLKDRLGDFGAWATSVPKLIGDDFANGAHFLKDALVNAVKDALDAALSYVKDHNPFDWLSSHMPKLSLPFGLGGGAGGAPGNGPFGLSGVTGAVYSSTAGESGLLGGRTPAADLDYLLPAGSHDPVILPGGKSTKYSVKSYQQVPGIGGEETLSGPTGNFAFLHLAAGVAPGTYHGGQQVGVTGWPTDPRYGNGTAGPSNAQLCVVYDAGGNPMGVTYLTPSQIAEAGRGGGLGGLSISGAGRALAKPLAAPTGHGTTMPAQTYGAPSVNATYGWGQAAWSYPGGANAGQPPGWGQAVWTAPGGTPGQYLPGPVKDNPAAIAKQNALLAQTPNPVGSLAWQQDPNAVGSPAWIAKHGTDTSTVPSYRLPSGTLAFAPSQTYSTQATYSTVGGGTSITGAARSGMEDILALAKAAKDAALPVNVFGTTSQKIGTAFSSSMDLLKGAMLTGTGDVQQLAASAATASASQTNLATISLNASTMVDRINGQFSSSVSALSSKLSGDLSNAIDKETYDLINHTGDLNADDSAIQRAKSGMDIFQNAVSRATSATLGVYDADMQAANATYQTALANYENARASGASAASLTDLMNKAVAAGVALQGLQSIPTEIQNAIQNAMASSGANSTSSASSSANLNPGGSINTSSSASSSANLNPGGSINTSSPYNNAPNANTLAQLKAGGPANGSGGTLLGFDSNGNPVYQDVNGGTRTDLLGSNAPGGAPTASPGQPGQGGGMNYPGGGGNYPGLSGGGSAPSVAAGLTAGAGGYTGYGTNTPGYASGATGSAAAASSGANTIPFGGATIYNANPGIFGTSSASNAFNQQSIKYGQGSSLSPLEMNDLYGTNSASGQANPGSAYNYLTNSFANPQLAAIAANTAATATAAQQTADNTQAALDAANQQIAALQSLNQTLQDELYAANAGAGAIAAGQTDLAQFVGQAPALALAGSGS